MSDFGPQITAARLYDEGSPAQVEGSLSRLPAK